MKTKEYIDSITFTADKMTEVISTKFPESDVKNIDFLIQKGVSLSRSDLIPEATREKIRECSEQKSDFDLMHG